MTQDPMAEIRASFFIECQELLESLQDALASLEESDGDGDPETVNVIFRAVHSIKGGAGAFALTDLVEFAHVFETLLDELRAQRLAATPDLIRLLFQGADALQDHVQAAATDGPPPANSAALMAQFAEFAPVATAETELEDAPAFQPMVLSFDTLAEDDPIAFDLSADLPTPAQNIWLIEFRPHAGLYASGNEAAYLLRGVGELGEVQTSCEAVEDLHLGLTHPEDPKLTWRIRLVSDCSENDIREVFEFVVDDCDLIIARPGDASPSDLGGEDLHKDNLFSDPDAPIAAPIAPPPNDPSPAPMIFAEAAASIPDNPIHLNDSAPMSPSAAPTSPTTPSSSTDPTPAEPTAQAKPASQPDAETPAATVRVDLERIDRLVNLVGELVINQAMLSQSVADAGISEDTLVANGLEDFTRLTREIQDGVMMIRAQPVKPLFQRMARVLREASSAIGKQVRLKTEGESTEVDKTIIERLAEPLTHMIRNAVDHGLESSDDRVKAGKSDVGTIVLSASHRSGRINIELSDDGSGINRARVKEIAINKGLVPSDAQLTDNEIDNLIFLPGFSTASTVSALSGRGVGMDVVRNTISSLGGRVSISSEPGQGTKFTISLPLTLAILDGMVVRVADQTMVVPLSTILETAKLTEENIRKIGSTVELLYIREELVALYDLGTALGFRTTGQRAQDAIAILIQNDDGTRAALIVDGIMEQRQVVIKGLERNVGRMRGIAAATILGDGKIALIVDTSGLTQARPAPSSEPSHYTGYTQ